MTMPRIREGDDIIELERYDCHEHTTSVQNATL